MLVSRLIMWREDKLEHIKYTNKHTLYKIINKLQTLYAYRLASIESWHNMVAKFILLASSV